jgi:hypothetical protein
MNETLYPQYMRMSEERLRKHLHKKETPPAIVNDIVEVVLRQREQLRTERIKKTVHKKVWDEILQPLRKEIKLVTASLLYSPSTNNPTLDDHLRLSNGKIYPQPPKKSRHDCPPCSTA